MTEPYEDAVDYFAQNKLDFIIRNTGVKHARLCISKILQYAKKEVKMIVNEDDVIDEECICAMTNFLNRPDTSIKIIFTFPAFKTVNTLMLLHKIKETDAYAFNNVQALFTNQGHKFTMTTDDKETRNVVFVVADDSAYRLETDLAKHNAQINFKGKKLAKHLSKIFDEAFKSDNFRTLDFNRLQELPELNGKPTLDERHVGITKNEIQLALSTCNGNIRWHGGIEDAVNAVYYLIKQKLHK